MSAASPRPFDLIGYARAHGYRLRNLHDGAPVPPLRPDHASRRSRGYVGVDDRDDAIVGRYGYVDVVGQPPGRLGFYISGRSRRALAARLKALAGCNPVLLQVGDTEAAGHVAAERIAELLAVLKPYRRRSAPAGARPPGLQAAQTARVD